MNFIRYIVDTWAWYEYLDATEKGIKVKELIENPDDEIFTNSIAIAELASVLKRNNRDYESILKTVLSIAKLVYEDADFSIEVGLSHAKIREKIKDFGMTDAFILTTARKLNAKIITGDPHFKDFKEAIVVY